MNKDKICPACAGELKIDPTNWDLLGPKCKDCGYVHPDHYAPNTFHAVLQQEEENEPYYDI